MSAFNIVSFDFVAPLGKKYPLTVQFKYGDTWQYEYVVGDRLNWGGNDIGSMKFGKVVAIGCLDGDAPDPEIPFDWEVHIDNGTIRRVIPATGRFDFVRSEEPFFVID